MSGFAPGIPGTESDLPVRAAAAARDALDSWVREVVEWHFNPETGSPFWVGLGALSLDLIAALVVSSLLRRRVGARAWRAIHWAAYLSWPLAFANSAAARIEPMLSLGWQVSPSVRKLSMKSR